MWDAGKKMHPNFARKTIAALIFLVVNPVVFAGWDHKDIGSPAMAGSTIATSGDTVFTLEGGGGNVGGSSDQGHFAYTQQSGNFELTARLNSLETGTSSNAQAGIIARQHPGQGEMAADGPFAMVSAVVGGGVRFSYRLTAATAATSVDVSGVAVPVWLRLKKTGSDFTGFYSADGNVWTQIGQQTVSEIGAVSAAGLVVSSANPGQLCTAGFDKVSAASHVPLAGGSLRLWLRADTGVTTTSGSAVTTWLDQSGQGNNAVQATAGYRPVVVQDALSGKPVIRFTATSNHYLGVTNNTSLALDRVAVYAVVKRTSGTAAAVILEQFTANTAGYSLQASTAVGRAFRINGTVSSFNLASGTSFNLLSGTYDMANRKLFVDGSEEATAALTAATGAKTNNLYIGSRVTTTPSASLAGDIAEILVYSEVPTAKESLELGAYFHSKYGVGAQPVLPQPVSSVAPGTYSTAQAVTLSLPAEAAGAVIYYTLNEAAPLAEWSVYTGSVNINSTGKLRAVAVKSGFGNSAVTECSIAINAGTNYVSRAGLALWLKADEGVITTGGLVDSWTDQSGSGVQMLGLSTSKPASTTATFSQVQPAGASRSVIRFANSATVANRTYLRSAELKPLTLDKVTVFAVTNRSSATVSNQVIAEQFTPNTTGFSLQSTNASDRVFRIQGGITTHTSPNASTAFELVEGNFNKAARAVRIDGGTDPTRMTQAAQAATMGNPNQYFYVGGRGTATGTNLDGDVAEILIYNREFSSSTTDQDEYRKIMAYLYDKYGVAYKPAARAPTISLAKNIFPEPLAVVLTNTEPDSTIYYTLDGSVPTVESTVYTGSFVVSQTRQIRAIAVKERFSNSPELTYDVIIDPTAVYVAQSGLNVWLRADAGVTTESGNTAQWRDQSGHSFFAAQAAAGQRPLAPAAESGTLNGQKKIIFTPVNSSRLILPSNAALNSSSVSLFAIATKSFWTSTRYTVISKEAGSTGYGLAFSNGRDSPVFLTNGAKLEVLYGGSGTSSGLLGARNSLSAGKEIFFNGKSLLRENGVTISSSGSQDMLIGHGGQASTYMSGGIAEVFVYDRSITDDERRNLEAYAYMRYGIDCQPEARAPEFSQSNASGGWGGKVITIINREPGAEVRYTTDGSEPNPDSPLYTAEITLARSTTIKAAAFKMGYGRSAISVQTWEFNPKWTRTEIGSLPLEQTAFTAPLSDWNVFAPGGGFGTSGDNVTFVSLHGIQGSGMDWISSVPVLGLRGIMARSSTQKDASFVFLGFNSSGECHFICRPATGATTLIDRVISGVTSGSQLRLQLVGNTVLAFTKAVGGSWVRRQGNDLYDARGPEIGRGLKDSGGQPVDSCLMGMCFVSYAQGISTLHSVASTSMSLLVEQQMVRWHRLLEPKENSPNFHWSQNFFDKADDSAWPGPFLREGLAGGDFWKGEAVTGQLVPTRIFSGVRIGTSKSVDLYVRLASSTGTTLPARISVPHADVRNLIAEVQVDSTQAQDTWHYVGSLTRNLYRDHLDWIEINLTAEGPGFLALDGFMLVASESDMDFNQNGIADGANDQEYRLSPHGDLNGDGWSNYLTYLATGDPLAVAAAGTEYTREPFVSLAPDQPDSISMAAGGWMPHPIRFLITYKGTSIPVPGCEFTASMEGLGTDFNNGAFPYHPAWARMAGSPDHVPQIYPLKLTSDENGIAKIWVFKGLSYPRENTPFCATVIGKNGQQRSPMVNVHSYPNSLPGGISVQPESTDLRKTLTQPWPHSTSGSFVVKGDIMAVGVPASNLDSHGPHVQFHRWNKTTGDWQMAEALLPSAGASFPTAEFGRRLKLIEDGSNLKLMVESLGGYFVYALEVSESAVVAELESSLATDPEQTFSMAGNLIALGQAEHGDSGRVRLYRKVAGEWSLLTTLTPATSAASDHFGRSLSFSTDGQRLAIGAPGDAQWHLADPPPAGPAPADPAVYVYCWNSVSVAWEEEQKLELQAPVNAAFGFGEKVAFMSNDTLVAGSPYAETEDSVNSLAGRLELFKLGAGSVWVRTAVQEGDSPSYGKDFVVDDSNIFVNVTPALGEASASPLFDDAHLAHLVWNAASGALTETRLLRFSEDRPLAVKADGESLFLLRDGYFEQYEMLPRVDFDAPAGTLVATVGFDDADLDWPYGNLLQIHAQPPFHGLSVVEALSAEVEAEVPPPLQNPWALETPVTNPQKSRKLAVQSSAHLQSLRGEVSWLNIRITDHAGATDFETVGISVVDSLPAQPALLQAEAGGNSLVSIHWGVPSVPPKGYVMERAPLADYQTAVSSSADLSTVFRKVARPPVHDNAYNDYVSTASAGYAYRLKSWNDTGYSTYTSPVIVDLFAGAYDWPDWWASTYGSLAPGADADGDGWTNLQEFQNGTNPLVADTDGDGVRDSIDNAPLNATKATVRHVLHTELVQ